LNHHDWRHGSKQKSLKKQDLIYDPSLLVWALVPSKMAELFPLVFNGLFSKCRAGQGTKPSLPALALATGATSALHQFKTSGDWERRGAMFDSIFRCGRPLRIKQPTVIASQRVARMRAR
jgi:hypothetical protein